MGAAATQLTETKMHLFILSILLLFQPTMEKILGAEERAELIKIVGKQKRLNNRDRLNIRFSQVGTHLGTKENIIIYSSITTNEECVLERFDDVEKLCQDIPRLKCKKELVLKRKLVAEDCSKQEEYCFSSVNNISVPMKTALCQDSFKVECNQTQIRKEKCYKNSLAICSERPELVTVTMKKQPCGKDAKPTISKVCVTFPQGNWRCHNLTDISLCHEKNVTKIISTEVSPSKMAIECDEKIIEPFCVNTTCKVISKTQECFQDEITTQVDLKETICDKCIQDRTTWRHVLEEIEICRWSQDEFCNDSRTSKWKKWCRPLSELILHGNLAVPALTGL